MITEDEIKRAVVPFFRNFYRYRYAIQFGSDRADFDQTDTAGHIIDGRLRFEKDDGSPFTCTWEATSADKLEEVKFTRNWPLFLWECAAWSSLVVAAFYVILWRIRFDFIRNLEWQGNIGLLLGFALIAFSTFFFVWKNAAKFRYIYAVEQFKAFHADEQWVALAADAFPERDDLNFAELRRQLIFNGFGLVLVSNSGAVQPVITPSRLGKFGASRKSFEFFTETELVKKTVRFAEKKPLRWSFNLFSTVGKKGWQLAHGDQLADQLNEKLTQPMTRFARSHFNQKALFGLGLLITTAVFWQIKDWQSIVYVNEADWKSTISKKEIPYEDEGFLPGEDVVYKKKPAAWLDDSLPTEPDLSGSPQNWPTDETGDDETGFSLENGAEKNVLVLNSDEEKPATKPAKQVAKPASKPVNPAASICEKWAKTSGWLIQDNSFSQADLAKNRLAILQKNGFSGHLIPRNCLFGKGETGWVILLGGVFPEEKLARSSAASFEKKEARLGLKIQKLLVRKKGS